ncbi:uncharacterized protein [Primulina huaijiensis]|uniref:uncharacterized protein n=1 Tax=Primulina huaijiensis TaxID=1492673 RepID=UPI003CC71B36
MLNYKQKKNQPVKGKRFLISVTVLGSAGPIRFVVNEEDLVAAVIETALKSYAREGRIPVLGSNLNHFMLYCPISGTEVYSALLINGCFYTNVPAKMRTNIYLDSLFSIALSPWDNIGAVGVRNFMLCKKPLTENAIDGEKSPTVSRKAAGSWKTWFHKSLSLKISSH